MSVSGHGALTYAAFSGTGRTRGGWQVGARVGDLGDAEVQQLREWIPTTLTGVRRVGKFPSDADIRSLETRTAWTHAPWGGGDRVFWHSCAAGADATGRSGNVFTVAYVVRAGDHRWRPVQLVQPLSPPDPVYGAAAVDGFVLDAGILDQLDEEPSGAVEGMAGLWDWASAPSRRAVLVRILDALAAGDVVALVAPPAEGPWNAQAERWLEVLSRLLTPAAAQDLGWSTMECAAKLGRNRATGVRVAAIPAGDADAAAANPGVAVVRLDDAAPEPAASAWGRLADVLLREGRAMDMERTDPVPESRVPEARVAATVARDPELRRRCRGDLGELVSAHGPGILGAVPGDAVVEDLVGDGLDGATGADLLRALEGIAERELLVGPLLDAARGRIRRTALVDQLLEGHVDAPAAVGRPHPRVTGLLCEEIAADPALADVIARAWGLPRGLAEWLGIPALARARAAAADPGRFSDDGAEGLLAGAWALAGPGTGRGRAAASPGAAVGRGIGSLFGEEPSDADARARVFGLNSLHAGFHAVAAVREAVTRARDALPAAERRLLDDGPWGRPPGSRGAVADWESDAGPYPGGYGGAGYGDEEPTAPAPDARPRPGAGAYGAEGSYGPAAVGYGAGPGYGSGAGYGGADPYAAEEPGPRGSGGGRRRTAFDGPGVPEGLLRWLADAPATFHEEPRRVEDAVGRYETEAGRLRMWEVLALVLLLPGAGDPLVRRAQRTVLAAGIHRELGAREADPEHRQLPWWRFFAFDDHDRDEILRMGVEPFAVRGARPAGIADSAGRPEALRQILAPLVGAAGGAGDPRRI